MTDAWRWLRRVERWLVYVAMLSGLALLGFLGAATVDKVLHAGAGPP